MMLYFSVFVLAVHLSILDLSVASETSNPAGDADARIPLEDAGLPSPPEKKSLLMALMDQVKLNVPSQGLSVPGGKRPRGNKPSLPMQLRSVTAQQSAPAKKSTPLIPESSTAEELEAVTCPYSCGEDGRTCIEERQMCDGKPDCPAREDEHPRVCAVIAILAQPELYKDRL